MIHNFLSKWAKQNPHKTAVTQGRHRVTYEELERSTSKVASFLLSCGVQRGARVGILSKNSAEYIASYLGVQRAGGITVDINFQDSAHEIKTIINHSGVTVLIAENAFAAVVLEALQECSSIKTLVTIEGPLNRPFPKGNVPAGLHCIAWGSLMSEENGLCSAPDQSAQDLAAIVYTSGTTGRPKGVMLSHDNIVSNARSIVAYLQLTIDDKVMVVLPFCYSYGKSLLTTHLMQGGELVLENSFMYPNAVFEKMIEEGVTGFAGVPSTFSIMLNKSNFSKYRFPNLRYVTQAGGAMPPQHAQELSACLTGTKIFIMYGQTEATARLTYLEPSDLSRKPGSIGKAIPGVEIKLVSDQDSPAAVGQEGEIVARGKNIMLGYWNDPEATQTVLRNGWLHTGDIAIMDEDGYFAIVGRNSDMIKSGAHRISPTEIEEAILELREVFEVCVVGIPDEILGETIRAVVVLKEGSVIDAHAVQRHCQMRLASFKIPKEVVFTGALPKTNSGKIMRYKLKLEPSESVSAAPRKAVS
jgi:long-chain acyl-CoA synthetase